MNNVVFADVISLEDVVWFAAFKTVEDDSVFDAAALQIAIFLFHFFLQCVNFLSLNVNITFYI